MPGGDEAHFNVDSNQTQNKIFAQLRIYVERNDNS